MSSFVLKIIAVITMVIDHSGYVIFHQFSFMNYIGRLSFPLFAFQLTQGYIHTHNKKKYFLRLLILAIVSQVPFMLFKSCFFEGLEFNIFFTLMLGMITLFIWDKLKENSRFLAISLSLLIIVAGYFLKVDYSAFGVASIFIFYIFKNKKMLQNVSFILISFLEFLPSLISSNFYYAYVVLFLFTISSLILINRYNHQKGKSFQSVFYWFYPVHLIVLYLLYSFSM